MSGNVKILGLALVAAFAMSAMVASAASANANYWFTSPGSDWTSLSGSQNVAFTDEAKFDGIVPGGPQGILKCETITYSGALSATTTTTITLAAVYGNCELSPFGKATISMNGCVYVIHTDPLGDTTNGEYDTVTTIDCPAGNEITIESKITGITKCIIHIEPQNLGTGIVLKNKAGGGFEATINFSNIKYTQTTGTAGANRCTTTVTTNNGIYTGAATITGRDTAANAVAINAST